MNHTVEEIKNQVLDCITSRRSVGSLVKPAPNDEEVKTAIAAAITAPDHRGLQPWQFIVVREDRLREFGEMAAECLVAEGETDVVLLEKVKEQPFRAPMLIVCLMKYKANANVPHFEQVLSAGAAVENLLLALNSMGYASIWRTGAIVQNPTFKEELGCGEQDLIAGIIYVGTAEHAPAKKDSLNVDDFLTAW